MWSYRRLPPAPIAAFGCSTYPASLGPCRNAASTEADSSDDRKLRTRPLASSAAARAQRAGLAGDIDDLRQWQREGVAFVVLDTETGADVTRVLLA